MPGLTLDKALVLALLLAGVPFTLLIARQRLRHTSAALRGLVIGVRVAIVSVLLLALAELVAADGVSSGPPPGATTDLGASLRMASAILARSPGLAPEVVLLSDGWENNARPSSTGGGVAPLAPRGAAEALPPGVSISYVAPPRPAPAPPAVVRSVDLPASVRVGEPVEVPIEIHAGEGGQARLRIWLDGSPVADGPIQLQPGINHASLERRLGTAGFPELGVELVEGSGGL